MQRWLLALLSAALVTAATTCGAADAAQEAAAAINPRYLLQDGKGRAVSNEDFPGRFQLITFGYTYCPDICPTTLATVTLILGRLGNKAARLQPIFISVDPERDSGAAISRYTAYFDARILGLTGPAAFVRSAADHYQVTYQKYATPGAGPRDYAVDHSAGMFLLDPDGEFITRFAYAATAQDIAARIDAIMAATDCATSGGAAAKCEMEK